MDERRYYKRLNLQGNVIIRTGNGGARLLKATLDDLSMGGFRIHTAKRFSVDEDLEFELKTKFLEKPLEGRGRVRYVARPDGQLFPSFSTGVKFKGPEREMAWQAIKSSQKRKRDARLNRKEVAGDLSFVIKCLPLLFAVSWFVSGITNNMALSMDASRKYNEQFKQALITYLNNNGVTNK